MQTQPLLQVMSNENNEILALVGITFFTSPTSYWNTFYFPLDTDVPSLAPRRSSLAAKRKALNQNKSDPNISALQSTSEDVLAERKVRNQIMLNTISRERWIKMEYEGPLQLLMLYFYLIFVECSSVESSSPSISVRGCNMGGSSTRSKWTTTCHKIYDHAAIKQR